MPKSATELIVLRNDFYLRSYDQIKTVVVVLLLILILLIGFAIHQHGALEPQPKYFPTTPDGRLIAMPPVDENHLLLKAQKVNPETGIIVGMPEPTRTYAELEVYGDNGLVIFWAYLAVQDMFDYDYIHYRRVIQQASKYFTAKGHDNFIEALQDSKNLETVKSRQAVVFPEVTGHIILKGMRMFEGHYVWDLDVPVRLTYASVKDDQPIIQNLMAHLSIARVSTLQNPFYGLAIFRLNFEQVFEQGGTK